MNIMDRLSRLIRANVNDLIERAEDPERTLDQLLRDMHSNITTARAQVASMIAQEKELEADYDETSQLAIEWRQKAQRAVDAGKDELAREALRRRRDSEENSSVYERQLNLQRQTVERLKSQLRQLESKYQTTLSQRDSLIARQRRAQATHQVSATLSSFSPMDPTSELDQMERRIRSTESRVEALNEMSDDSIDAQFSELDGDDDIEAELQALKSDSTAPVAALNSGASESSGNGKARNASPGGNGGSL
ncbi:MAG: PspA/IM30 family protein [Chloroflexia bacterium]|nr:PspA/IM30 family protein [Chloroflexia bacterium]